MINLDEALTRWATASSSNSPVDWNPDLAKQFADEIAAKGGYRLQWESGDEDWILLANEHAYQGMISIHYPLALLTPGAATTARHLNTNLDLVEITDYLDENLSANPQLLRVTALPNGWDDDFTPEAFCANDLFVEGV